MVGALSFASPSYRGFHWIYNPKVENALVNLGQRVGKSVDNFHLRVLMVDLTFKFLEKTITFSMKIYEISRIRVFTIFLGEK